MHVLLIYLEPLVNEPIGLMYIGTVLEKEGHLVKIVGTKNRHYEKNFLKEIHNFKAELVGLSIPTPLAGKAKVISRVIKDNFSKITIIAGGPHPTILPYSTLTDIGVDICVIGEGELTIIDLVEALSKGRGLDDVKGIGFLRNGNLVLTKKREYISNLDSLPFVDRKLMPKDVIYGRAGYPLGNPCMLLMTVRGCPYRCTFCQPTVDRIFGKLRRRSPENVICEIAELKRLYGINGLWINDDTFLFDDKWTERFCDLITEERLDITWYTNGRLNNANEDILVKMRDAGCVGLVMTPEAGSQRIRNEVLNKGITDEQVLKAYEICEKINLPVQANIMLASPTETEEELNLSLTLIKRIQPHFMNLSYTTALPGTYLHEKYAKEVFTSPYYKDYENYDIGRFKKLNLDIPDSRLLSTWKFFAKTYTTSSFTNRARHFFCYPYFRKILYRRWKTLAFNRHPNFKHLIFDIVAIFLGSFIYVAKRGSYRRGSEIKHEK